MTNRELKSKVFALGNRLAPKMDARMTLDYHITPGKPGKGQRNMSEKKKEPPMPIRRYDYVSYPIANTLAHTPGYCMISVVGTSMINAGINGGDHVIFSNCYEWVDGAIMLIIQEREGKKFSQMHRVRKIRGKWFQCWEDGSETKILLDDSYYPHGLLVAVAQCAMKLTA